MKRPTRPLPALILLPLSLCLLAGCASRPPEPGWALDAHAAAGRATEAYLSGDTRVADLEWSRARAEVARTGRPDLLARVELLRCAAQKAALDLQACTAFEALRPDAAPPERAYADYLAGRLAPADAALLPPAQRQAASAAQAGAGAIAIAGIEDPLSRLVAAAVAVQAGLAYDALMASAAEAASARGWRRPLLAWLGLRARLAAERGDGAGAAALQRRIALVESQGAPPRR